jgi:hypothetical protein
MPRLSPGLSAYLQQSLLPEPPYEDDLPSPKTVAARPGHNYSIAPEVLYNTTKIAKNFTKGLSKKAKTENSL